MGVREIMRATRTFTAACILAAAFLFSASFAAAQEITLNTAAPEFRIIDGDSIDYGYLHFRLCGIQAPERNVFYYEKATDMLRRLVGKRTIVARLVDIDKYGRQIAVIRRTRTAVKTINEEMVVQGGAKHYKRYSKNCEPYISRRALIKAEKSARRRGLGIWKE